MDEFKKEQFLGKLFVEILYLYGNVAGYRAYHITYKLQDCHVEFEIRLYNVDPKQLLFTGPSYTQRARKQATRGSHICKYLYRRNGKEMFTLIQKERIMHLFTTSQTIFPSDMTSRVRQDISHNCILCMCNNSQINKSHCSSNNIFTYGMGSFTNYVVKILGFFKPPTPLMVFTLTNKDHLPQRPSKIF